LQALALNGFRCPRPVLGEVHQRYVKDSVPQTDDLIRNVAKTAVISARCCRDRDMTPEERNARIRAMRCGATVQTIADEVSLTRESVRQILMQRIVPQSNMRQNTRDEVEQRLVAMDAAVLYRNGMSMTRIAAEASCGCKLVQRWLHQQGMETPSLIDRKVARQR
jgi:hypothetical protein